MNDSRSGFMSIWLTRRRRGVGAWDHVKSDSGVSLLIVVPDWASGSAGHAEPTGLLAAKPDPAQERSKNMSFIDPRDGKRHRNGKFATILADRPAPSGEANLRHTPNCNSVLFNGPMAECDCGLIAPAPQMVEDFDRAERVFKSVGSGENVYEAFAAEFAIIRAAERNRARREALEEPDFD